MRVVVAVVVLGILLAVPGSACWITLYRPDGAYSGGYGVWNPFDGEHLGLGIDLPARTVAYQFQPYRTAEFHGGFIGLTCLDGPCEFEVELREDDGNLPGALIESFTSDTWWMPGMSFDSSAHHMLSGDALYWLVAKEPNGNPSLWAYHDYFIGPPWDSAIGRMAFQQPPYYPFWVGLDNQRMGAFIIYGSPEPGSGAMVLGGLALLGVGAWRVKRPLTSRTPWRYAWRSRRSAR